MVLNACSLQKLEWMIYLNLGVMLNYELVTNILVGGTQLEKSLPC